MPGTPGTMRPQGGQGAHGTRALAARVRASKHLSGTLKRYWLTVLPHLQPADRERLDAILRGEMTGDGQSPAGPAEPADPVGGGAGGEH
ncbi:MAG TPA: hypothetical protein VGJ54_09725 [Streptosporangiaceae bacterium]